MRRQFTRLVTGLGLLTLALLLTAPSPAEPTVDDPSQMTTEQMVESAKEMVNEMEEMLTASFTLLEKSITASDVAATAIRNEAITAMKGLVKLSEENLMTMQQKNAEKDRDGVEHEYVKISIAAAKVAELYAQVKTASGIDVDIEATKVDRTLEIKSSLPADLETASDFSEPVDTLPDDPVHASPTI